MINGAFPYVKKYANVSGLKMAYVEEGSGDPIVFLHGNPTSSYIWRNIMPYAQEHGRCIAPDLIGMGDSDKLPDSGPHAYTFVEHRRYLDELLSSLGVRQNVMLVMHDWGSALGFDWAARHPGAVKGIVYMEAILKSRSWNDLPEKGRAIFQKLRSPEGEHMVLAHNSFIEGNLPQTVLRELTQEEMDHYRKPFAEPGEGRRPTLSWARQLPFDGEPADVAEVIDAYGAWLARSGVPKLFIHSEPGTLPESHIAFCRSWPNQTEVSVRGHHTPQEDSPDDIGSAIGSWLKHGLRHGSWSD